MTLCFVYSEAHPISQVRRFNKLLQSNLLICYSQSSSSFMIFWTCKRIFKKVNRLKIMLGGKTS